ncbi:hypothetical protein BHE74_00002380 [Ensete ventricosum]|nr:hypothetical protein BHE74_00002380 [Ensete ventricosum]RZR81939.1 hypothetical protein BHM03_00008249 [Ensete ventricosum]
MWRSDARATTDGCDRRLEIAVPSRGRRGVEDTDAAVEGRDVAGEAIEAVVAGNKWQRWTETGMGEEDAGNGCSVVVAAISASCRRVAAYVQKTKEGRTPIEFQGRRSPIEITPSLESTRVLILGIRATFLASRCPSIVAYLPFIVAQSNSHNCLEYRRIPPSSPLRRSSLISP